jgi:hypothetical protein
LVRSVPPNGASESDDPEEAVVDVLARALQPIVAALQDRNIGEGEWYEAIKIASCRAAHDAADTETGRANCSRMSIRTGISRAEHIDLRKRMTMGRSGRRSVGSHRLTRVLHGWLSDSRFRDHTGRSLPLSADGPAPNFGTLTRAFSGDVPSVTVVAELVEYGLIFDVGAAYCSPSTTHRERAMDGALQFEQVMQRNLTPLVRDLRIRKTRRS